MDYITCALCETDDTQLYQKENGYQAVQCRYCGLVYVNPRPSIEEMKELYEGQETQIDLHAHLHRRDQKCIEARKQLKLIQKYRSGGRLLDIGSAAGYFLWEARQAGFEVQGLDLTHPFVQFSSEVLGIPTFEGTLRQANFPESSFDVIYHRNVLSHLAHPVEEFEIMHRLLAPGGVLVFETGNVAEMPAEDAGFLELPDHLYHFSEVTILKLLHRTRFTHLKTHRYMLISQLPVIRKIKHAFKQRTLRERRSRPASENELHEMPQSVLKERLKAHWAQFFRYDVGVALPKKGRRCTLVVVAKK